MTRDGLALQGRCCDKIPPGFTKGCGSLVNETSLGTTARMRLMSMQTRAEPIPGSMTLLVLTLLASGRVDPCFAPDPGRLRVRGGPQRVCRFSEAALYETVVGGRC
jgi:hypothetical protein